MRKFKTYYSTADIMELYEISERTIRYRLLELKEKYKGRPSLLSKNNKKWRINHTIIKEFAPKRNNKKKYVRSNRRESRLYAIAKATINNIYRNPLW